MKVRFLIVGAGPTGIGAAHNLLARGEDFLLIDREARPGGLARSVVDGKGFTWDMGGHVQFSHYEQFDAYMDRALGADGWLNHKRQSWIWVGERFVPFPLQKNLHRLPEAQRQRCVDGLRGRHAPNGHRPANFKDWIDDNFGPGIAEVFMVPYNLKTWAHPLELMSCRWVGDRVAMPSLEEIERATASMTDDVDWGPNACFRFPKHGGTGAVWEALARRLNPENLRLGDGMVAVDAGRHVATLAGGLDVSYEEMVSTAPLDRLTAMAGLDGLSRATARLRHSTTHVVGIGVAGSPPEHLREKNWMYFPEGDCPFYRVTVFSNYSPNNVPSPDHWSLMAEVSESGFKAVNGPSVVGDVISGMRATRLLSRESRIVSRWHRALPYGYPIPTVDRDGILDEVLPDLERLGIYSRGRFGAWKYEVANQDHSFMQGWECIDRILTGRGPEAEPTLHSPEQVNAHVAARR